MEFGTHHSGDYNNQNKQITGQILYSQTQITMRKIFTETERRLEAIARGWGNGGGSQG